MCIFKKAVQPIKSCTTRQKSCTSLVHCPSLLISLTMVFVQKCTVFSKPVQILWSSYVYFQKAVQQLKSCTAKEKSCTFLVHCPWLLISLRNSLTMMLGQKRYSFFQSCTNSVVLICIFLKSCTTNKKLYNQRKKLYIFGTLSLAPNFIDDGVCTKMYSFFESCTNSVVLICIFLKSCTTNKKLYNQRKKLYIFGTLSLAPNFIDKGVCTKFTVFAKAVQILWSSYVYF